MKIPNLFRAKRPTPRITVPPMTAANLQAMADALIEDWLTNAPESDSRVLELALKNGSLIVEIEIAPAQRITVRADPGVVRTFEFQPT